MSEPGAGTPVQGQVDLNRIGEQMVMGLLSTGAGDGPDQATVRIVGDYLAQALGTGLDILTAVGVGATPEDALRIVLNLPTDTVPAAQLSDAAAIALALRVGDEVHAAVPTDNLEAAEHNKQASTTSADIKNLLDAGIQTAAGAWTMRRAKTWLDACLDNFDDDYITAWDTRLAAAELWDTAFNAASLGPFVSASSPTDGNHVHTELQARFLREYGPTFQRPTAEILIERMIHRPAGTNTLDNLKNTHPRYHRLWLALRSPKTPSGHLRLDLAALNSMTIWEVKPVGSMATGVIQLFYYCSAYNCLAIAEKASERLLPSATPLNRRVLWPIKLPLKGDSKRPARSRFAIPFCLPHIPGVVGYVILVLPSLKGVTDAAKLAILLKHFQELSKRMRELRGQPANDNLEADFPVAAMVVLLAAILLTGAIAYAGPAVAAVLAAHAEAVATGAAAAAVLTSAAAAANTPPPPGDATEAVTLQTFAGDIVAPSKEDALRSLAALCSTLWLGLPAHPDAVLPPTR